MNWLDLIGAVTSLIVALTALVRAEDAHRKIDNHEHPDPSPHP